LCGTKMVQLSTSKRCSKTLAVGLLGALLALGGQDAPGANEKKNPFAGQKAAIEAGAQRFKAGCTACHGADAEGGRGPALAGNRDLQTMNDEQLFKTIRQGIPGTSMPPSQMPDDLTWQVAAFVRNLSSPASVSVLPGNSAAGRELFYGKGGCSGCHAIRGVGGSLGPDLSEAGANLTVRDLQESILHPSARIAPGFDPAVVILKNGNRIEGVAKDNTNYAMSVVDKDGRLHLLNKADVSRVEFSSRSLMPENAGQRLGPDGLNDVISFLASQTVRPVSSFEEQHRRRRIH
jgi:cytochrome c oxidase cbb3-type subunit 3